jgi:Zn-dependent protease with chaperone function
MITVTCRRCIAPSAVELDVVLDSGEIITCGACGKAVLRGERRERAISAANYILPRDVRTMRALRRVPGLVRAVQLYAKLVRDDDLLLDRYAATIEISDRQLPEVHELYIEAGRRLGIPAAGLPRLFVSGDRAPGATTAGVERPFIELTTGLLEVMSPDELVAVLGHELGHVQAGQISYLGAIRGFKQLAGVAANLTPFAIDEIAVKLLGDPALLAWLRTAERTADRAGMIAARRPRDMITAMMKLAGAPPSTVTGLDHRAFVEQSRRFDEIIERSLRHRLLVAKDVLQQSHPFPAIRVGEMLQLLGSPDWFDILERVLDPSPGAGGPLAGYGMTRTRARTWTETTPLRDDDVEQPRPNGGIVAAVTPMSRASWCTHERQLTAKNTRVSSKLKVSSTRIVAPST